jgi:hypothetical protein
MQKKGLSALLAKRRTYVSWRVLSWLEMHIRSTTSRPEPHSKELFLLTILSIDVPFSQRA